MRSQSNLPLACVIVGVGVLTLGSYWPSMPMVAAMGLVTLGATAMTVARFRRSPMLLPSLVLHLSVYAALYGVFVGAALHAAHARSGPRLELLAILDVVVSVIPVVFAGRLAWDALWFADSCDA